MAVSTHTNAVEGVPIARPVLHLSGAKLRLALEALIRAAEPIGGIERFAAETGVSFPLAWDADKSVAQTYQISGMPTLFIIDQRGLVRFVHAGFRPGDELQISAAIDSLL